MPIKCRECMKTGLPHDEHMTPAEMKEWRASKALFEAELARKQAVAVMWEQAVGASTDEIVAEPCTD